MNSSNERVSPIMIKSPLQAPFDIDKSAKIEYDCVIIEVMPAWK